MRTSNCPEERHLHCRTMAFAFDYTTKQRRTGPIAVFVTSPTSGNTWKFLEDTGRCPPEKTPRILRPTWIPWMRSIRTYKNRKITSDGHHLLELMIRNEPESASRLREHIEAVPGFGKGQIALEDRHHATLIRERLLRQFWRRMSRHGSFLLLLFLLAYLNRHLTDYQNMNLLLLDNYLQTSRPAEGMAPLRRKSRGHLSTQKRAAPPGRRSPQSRCLHRKVPGSVPHQPKPSSPLSLRKERPS